MNSEQRHLRRARQRALNRDLEVDLDLLRGWREAPDASLRSSHLLPALAVLTLAQQEGDDLLAAPPSWMIRGPSVHLGRHHPGHFPVDLLLHDLLDHERYRLGAPHVRLMLQERKRWMVQALCATSPTLLDGEPLHAGHPARPIAHRQALTLGRVTLRFKVVGDPAAWYQRARDLLRVQARPTLYLKRAGGICGAKHLLTPGQPCVLGRAYPKRGDVTRPEHWDVPDALGWDLAGLPDHERRHVAFRHAVIRPLSEDDWEIEPLSSRHHVSVNRAPITKARRLLPHDEIGLNTLLFHFHHPQALSASTQDTIKLQPLGDPFVLKTTSDPA